MPHAIIRGNNGRRHEVDFGDEPIRVEIYASDETVEIFVGQILRPMRRNADASRSSASHGTCSVRRLARPPGVRQRVASITACIAKWHSGSSAEHVSDGQDEILDCPRASSTPLWSNLPPQAQREFCLAHSEAPFPLSKRRKASQNA